MPRNFTKDELQQKLEQLRALDARGQGLKNRQYRRILENVSNFFSWAAQGLEQELERNHTDSKKQTELAKYLQKAGDAFRDLTADNVLEDGPEQLEAEKNSKFEEAMRLLADLPQVILDRDENGDLLFTHLERHGAAALGKRYRRGDLLSELSGLDALLGLDFGPAMERVEPELSEDKKAEHLAKGPVRDFRQDPDARMAASLLEGSSEVMATLEDLIRVVPNHNEERLLRQNIRALKYTADQAAGSTDPIAIRSAILQMTQQIKLIRACYEARGYAPGEIHPSGSQENVVFPPDPAKINLDDADALLERYFDESNPKVQAQIKAHSEAATLILPKNDFLRTIYHLSSKSPDEENVSADYAMLNATIELLVKIGLGVEDDNIKNDLRYVITPLANIREIITKRVDTEWSHEEVSSQARILPQQCQYFQQNLADFEKSADAETKRKVHAVLDPFLRRFANMDVTAIHESFRNRDMGAEGEKADWELPGAQEEELRNNAAPEGAQHCYSNAELYATRTQMLPGFFQRLVKNSLNELSALHEAMAVYDAGGAKAHVGTEHDNYMKWLNAVRMRMDSGISSLRQNFAAGKNNGLNLLQQELLLENLYGCAAFYRNIAKAARNYTEDQRSFVNACKKMAQTLEAALEKAVEPNRQPDALRAYVAFHSGRHMFELGEEQKLNATAKVAGAYQWAAENQYRPGMKLSVSDVNSKALEVQKDACFREYYRDQKAAPAPDPENPQAEAKNPVDQMQLNRTVNYSRHSPLLNAMRRPLVYCLSREEKLNALKELRKYGDMLDHCSGASKKYKNFYYSLKDLSLLDLDRMNSEELGKRLQDIYDKTAQYMKGKRTVSWFKVRREHFEQALDVLSVIDRCGPYGHRLAEQQILRTNSVRTHKLRKQPTVSLNSRSPEKLAERLARCRGIVATEQSRDIIALIEKQLRENKLTRASEATDAARLPALPGEVRSSVKLSDKLAQITSFLAQGGYHFSDSNARVPEMLALTITPAYRKDGEIVLDEAQYQRNVRVMKQHLATAELVREYSDQEKRTKLRDHPNANKCGQLRQEFNDKERSINAQIEAMDQHERGLVWKLTDKELQELMRKEHLLVTKELEERQSRERENAQLKSKRDEFGFNEALPQNNSKEEPQAGTLNKLRKEMGLDQKTEKTKTTQELKDELKEIKGLNV
ncbi:MAG: hypothetical protein IKQ04_10165 [Oscillospiraceae bacterium]|nr:hypothetical protein [Oscillospiraceae bacterium]